jgi:predicted DNA-binding transcriptional regulator AlpA
MQISKDKTAEAATPSPWLISKRQVLQLIGDPAYSTVWEWMRAGTFPLPIELGPPGGRSSMIAWYADEIHDWIANRPRRKLGQHEFRGRSAAEQIDTSQQRRREPKQGRANGALSNTE